MPFNQGFGLVNALQALDAASAVAPAPGNVNVTLPADAMAQLVRLSRSYGMALADVASVLLVGSLFELDQYGVNAPDVAQVRHARAQLAQVRQERAMLRRQEQNGEQNGEYPYCTPARATLKDASEVW